MHNTKQTKTDSENKRNKIPTVPVPEIQGKAKCGNKKAKPI